MIINFVLNLITVVRMWYKRLSDNYFIRVNFHDRPNIHPFDTLFDIFLLCNFRGWH